MKIPLEISYRGVDKSEAIESLIRQKASKLEQVCNYMNSCRVIVEKIHEHPKSGSPYRVRIDMTVPPGHELAVDKSPDAGKQYEPLDAVIRDAFEAARRQLKELTEKQRGDVKFHPEQAMEAVVTKLFPEQDYGFLQPLSGQEEVFFHRNSVINNDFDRIRVGTGVQFAALQDDQGVRATTVQIVSKPGATIDRDTKEEIEPPLGWKK
ncbi:HPF/RaiA family ribosome-associated protein [Oscillatoria salina]|uniref:HPF/RaiA family ribosome-associated protein n=1 Tax=Oscillatoria salina TaxID=331517 RepID=UPI0013B8E0C2|nr:HPF/RaiA family ribosome-associated protein [Oscillatoria salina]MBZ8180119.1 HPF/RaiA family ribosome-associated protein [Oscillatoria salina IIICB1]NET89583.1 HPF/RaiA family ribosome-associated protein [Kamptonema sp. SIO1D9]